MPTTTQTLRAETGGTEITRFNALRHGVLSRYTVLPWENSEEYQAIVSALVAEHVPAGPTEEHLVEEIAGVLWRKRRLRLAEAAAHRRGLNDSFAPYCDTAKMALVHLDIPDPSEAAGDAVRATAAETEEDIREVHKAEAMNRRALDILRSQREDRYKSALAALHEETRNWWSDMLNQDPNEAADGEEPATADEGGLQRFLKAEVFPWQDSWKKELANRSLIREQAFGESFDTDKLEPLARYEIHLDRKLERMLSMLLRLKEIRRPATED